MNMQTLKILGIVACSIRETNVRNIDLWHCHLDDYDNKVVSIRLDNCDFLELFDSFDRASFSDGWDELFMFLSSGAKVWTLIKADDLPGVPRTVKRLREE